MDEIVLRAIQKWPDVPSVYGWLALDRRGNWSIKGERIANPTITGFIARNYTHDDGGRWFFQNGPQRVFVQLAYTPLVLRTQGTAPRGLSLTDHRNESVADVRSAWLDEDGSCLIETAAGVGLVHDQDLPEIIVFLTDGDDQALNDAAIERLLSVAPGEALTNARLRIGQTAIPVSRIRSADVATHFRFNPDPRPAPGEPEC